MFQRPLLAACAKYRALHFVNGKSLHRDTSDTDWSPKGCYNARQPAALNDFRPTRNTNCTRPYFVGSLAEQGGAHDNNVVAIIGVINVLGQVTTGPRWVFACTPNSAQTSMPIWLSNLASDFAPQHRNGWIQFGIRFRNPSLDPNSENY